MAKSRIVDELEELELGEDEVLGTVDDLLEKEEKKEKKEAKKAETKEVPQQYNGKSVEDLVEMNIEAQKQISRQGNEIGELRKLTDQILQKQLQETTKPKEKPTEPDWEYNTKEAAEQLVNSKVNAIEARLEEDARQRELHEFQSKYPTYKEDAQSKDFQNWVTSSPIRTRVYVEADGGDLRAATDLFAEWERVQEARKEAQEVSEKESQEKNDKALKDASMEKGGNSGARKKIYRRADLINLRISDPDKFDSMQEEISLAYREGRVR